MRRLQVAPLGLVLGLAAAAAATLWIAPAAGGDLYPPGTVGADVSYPQCPAAVPAHGFVILGVNNGRPFRFNPCLAGEFRRASKSPLPSLYLNTGYDLYYRRWMTADCRQRRPALTPIQAGAWVIGCSEGESALAYSRRSGIRVAAAWWLDVEPDNSWSRTDLAANQATLQGAADALQSQGVPVGIYSDDSWWAAITGGAWNPAGVAMDWVGTVSASAAPQYCGLGFSDHPVWLVQYIAAGVDRDYVCPNPGG